MCCVEAIKSDDIAVQEDAANAVAALSEPVHLPQILHHLSDNNPLVRRVMLWTLHNYAAQIAYPEVLPYLYDADMAVREAALLLFMDGGVPATDTLVTAVGSSDDRTRFSAVQALGQFLAPEAIVPLMNAAVFANPNIREVAVLSLGVYAESMVVPSLIAALRDEPQIRLAALEGLRTRELSPDEEKTVFGCLSDELPEIRVAAVSVLGTRVPECAAGRIPTHGSAAPLPWSWSHRRHWNGAAGTPTRPCAWLPLSQWENTGI